MRDDYSTEFVNVSRLTMHPSQHQLGFMAIQVALYTWDETTQRWRRTPELLQNVEYSPPDFLLDITFTEPCTGVLYVYEHPDTRLQRAADRLRGVWGSAASPPAPAARSRHTTPGGASGRRQDAVSAPPGWLAQPVVKRLECDGRHTPAIKPPRQA